MPLPIVPAPTTPTKRISVMPIHFAFGVPSKLVPGRRFAWSAESFLDPQEQASDVVVPAVFVCRIDQLFAGLLQVGLGGKDFGHLVGIEFAGQSVAAEQEKIVGLQGKLSNIGGDASRGTYSPGNHVP